VPPKAKYDNRVRDLVLDRLLKDGMSIERALESIRREFLLDLSTGFVYDVLRDWAAEFDMAAHRRTVLERFTLPMIWRVRACEVYPVPATKRQSGPKVWAAGAPRKWRPGKDDSNPAESLG
jgi:hypothetical protein